MIRSAGPDPTPRGPDPSRGPDSSRGALIRPEGLGLPVGPCSVPRDLIRPAGPWFVPADLRSVPRAGFGT